MFRISAQYQCSRHTDPLRSLLRHGEEAYAVDSIVRQDGAYVKRIVAQGGGQLMSRDATFGSKAVQRRGAWSYFDWDCQDELLDPKSYRALMKAVDLDFSKAAPFDLQSSKAPPALKAIAREATNATWWQVCHPRINIVFSAASAIERLIAPTSPIAALLLSPFRECGITHSRDQENMLLVISPRTANFRTLARAQGNYVQHEAARMCDALCLSYWAYRADGYAALDALAHHMASDVPLALPPFRESVNVQIVGVRVGDTIFAQSLTTDAGKCRWPIEWKSLHILSSGRMGGAEYFPLPSAPTNKTVNPATFTRTGTKRCEQLLEQLGLLRGWT
ncbi:hypothetical protein [Rhizobacter fulvus]